MFSIRWLSNVPESFFERVHSVFIQLWVCIGERQREREREMFSITVTECPGEWSEAERVRVRVRGKMDGTTELCALPKL